MDLGVDSRVAKAVLGLMACRFGDRVARFGGVVCKMPTRVAQDGGVMLVCEVICA